jgi:signal transduction histidine kinase
MNRHEPVRLPELSETSIRWAVGMFCAFIGAFMLVAPNQFTGRAFAPVSGYRAGWALVALTAGVALLSVAVLRVQRRTLLAAHGLACVVLLSLSLGLAQSRSWIGVLSYVALAGGILAAARPRMRPTGDLLSVAMGCIGLLTGVMVALFPDSIHQPFGRHRSFLLLVGLAMAVTGPLLIYVQLRPPASRRWLQAAHLAAGGSLVVFGIVPAGPPPSWIGISLYLGIGSAIALLPWLREWTAGIDTSALRARLSLALAVATSLSLISAVAVSTTQEARLATFQATDTIAVEARSVAQNVRDYIALNGARATAVAALAGRLPLAAEPQAQLLVASRKGYPDTAGLLLAADDGTVIASDGGAALGNGTLRQVIATVHERPGIAVQLALDRLTGRTLLLEATPVAPPAGSPVAAGGDGRGDAVVVMALDPLALGERILREGSLVSLADGGGNLIATRNDSGVALDLPHGWDLPAETAPEVSSNRLAAIAPVPDFPWKVAVERPSEAALAGVDRGRDLAFSLLLVVLPLALAGGILTARRITRPLDTLADAVDELTAGNPWAPLEHSDIGEVERLSAAFREMRDRLATRTAESERLARELLARAETLADNDRRKDEFLAMLAHELRNPLGAISTAAYILGAGRPPEAVASRSVATIQRQSQHLARLVDDLLDVSRITLGKVELQRVALDLRAVIAEVVETTRPLAEARRHQLSVALPDTPLPVLADATRLEQVLANLVRNAIKFTEPAGRIEIVATGAGDRAVVRVRDSGAGIAPELLPRVFDLFTQGQQGLDRSVGGLGIGLTLVRSLAELHGGGVGVASDGPGRGSEFLVWLPLLPAGTPLAASTPLRTAAAGGGASAREP